MRARSVVRVLLLIAVTGFAGMCSADGQAAPPTVSFTLDFPAANPSHYEITVGRDGHGTYVSNGQLNKDSAADPALLQFTLSDRVREEIFQLAQRAHYFSGKVDSGNKNIANTGAKTLTYKDGQHDGQATYNYSPSVPVQQITAIFQGLSETLEFGRRLSFFHKYQKTALDEDLRRMEELQRDNSLGDVQAIAPVLKEIADDRSVMNVARARALRLMTAK
jgi:hypothetical protein